MFESFVSDFVKSFGDVTKDYVCGVFVLLSVGYGFVEDSEDSMRFSTFLTSVLVVVVENFAMDFEKGDGSEIFHMVLGYCAFGNKNHEGVYEKFWEIT